MNDRQAVELRKIERMRQALQEHTEWVKILQTPFLAGIRALNKELHEGVTEANKSYEAIRLQIEQDYETEMKEVQKRERANAQHTTTTTIGD